MSRREIELDSDDLHAVRGRLITAKENGETVRFSNGCSLYLDEKMYLTGTTPYGMDWFANDDDEWLESVINWLAYWNDSRDERGELLDLTLSFDGPTVSMRGR